VMGEGGLAAGAVVVVFVGCITSLVWASRVKWYFGSNTVNRCMYVAYLGEVCQVCACVYCVYVMRTCEGGK
jgi:hypothetical protein